MKMVRTPSLSPFFEIQSSTGLVKGYKPLPRVETEIIVFEITTPLPGYGMSVPPSGFHV